MVEAVAGREPARPGAGQRGARRPRPRPARAHHRRAPHRRRRPVRRRRRHGPDARADLRRGRGRRRPRPLLLLGPGGRRLDQALARELAGGGGLSLLCGRYEGVDDRVRTDLCDGELSIGDYVLAGGEVAAMVVLEAVGRLVPGVMGNAASAQEESFADGLLEYPQYTRPARVPGLAVPDVLRSGDHGRSRPLAAGRGAGPHGGRAPRPHRGPGWARRARPGAAGVVRRPVVGSAAPASGPERALCRIGGARRILQGPLRDRTLRPATPPASPPWPSGTDARNPSP